MDTNGSVQDGHRADRYKRPYRAPTYLAENKWVTGVISLSQRGGEFISLVGPYMSLPECQYRVLTSYRGPFKWKTCGYFNHTKYIGANGAPPEITSS